MKNSAWTFLKIGIFVIAKYLSSWNTDLGN